MKTCLLVCFAAVLLLACAPIAHATAVGISIVEQPVNLGVRSDPAKIPLGRVGVISNHGYGVHHFVCEARPCPNGAMTWKNGSELDQNLASVFGLSIESEDSTNILGGPVTVRLSAWKPPEYSPYSKDQVLAATIWCLIRSTFSTPERPLQIKVIAGRPDDKKLEAKYSGKYIREADEKKTTAPTSAVGGALIQEDALGIAWVILPGVKPSKAHKPVTPALVACENFGEGDEGWFILPVWGNGSDPDDFITMIKDPINLCYSAWKSHGLRNANVLAGMADHLSVSRSQESDAVSLGYVHGSQENLAAALFGMVLATQPTARKPLVVSFLCEESQIEKFSAFRKAPGWTETHQKGTTEGTAKRYEFEATFVWDPAGQKLLKGSLPGITTTDRHWITPGSE